MIEWPVGSEIAASCPNCGNEDTKQIILCTPWPDIAVGQVRISLLRCAACGCGFVHPAKTADYATEPASGDSALAFYLQQGAGLRGIAVNLLKLNRPRGTRLLEIGCGFGFGLDFARRILGWEVLGLDPSPAAAAGRVRLGLPIESRYLETDEPGLRDRFDVVMASEVIEHVLSPPTLLKAFRSALREGGTLVLTTPNVEAVGPRTPPGILVPLLSIGFHLVLQSPTSLAKLLSDAGFVDVDVGQSGGGQLVAVGRKSPVADSLSASTPAGSGGDDCYRRYLDNAARAAEAGSDLWLGLTARAYREAVNVSDRAAADLLWDEFTVGCGRRFGIDPETGAAKDAGPVDESLESLSLREPLCLGPVLLHRAFHRLLAGETRQSVESLFMCAASATNRLRRSLQLIGADDGDAEDVSWVATAEALLCAAERGTDGVVERFTAIGHSPADALAWRDGQLPRTDHYRRRIFVSLVNAARFEQADEFADVTAKASARAASPDAVLADDELDVLFCAAVRELQRNKSGAKKALDLLRQLHGACSAARAAGRTGSAVTLRQPAHDAEILALEVLGHKQQADALRRTKCAANAD